MFSFFCANRSVDISKIYLQLVVTISYLSSARYSVPSLIAVPSKVKAFVWFFVLNRLNTNDLDQRRRPYGLRSVYPPCNCVICMHNSESHAHLVLHCYLANRLYS